MSRYLTVAQVMEVTMAECDTEGGIRPWANARGLHPSIIDKFLTGQRGPSPQLLAALGLKQVTLYVKKAGDQ